MKKPETQPRRPLWRFGYAIGGVLMLWRPSDHSLRETWPALLGFAIACASAYLHLLDRKSPYSGPNAEIDDPITTLDLDAPTESERVIGQHTD
jgi:hypothetical protein